MTPEHKHEPGMAHIRIYSDEGLVTTFNINKDAVELAAEIFNQYMVTQA